VDFGRGNSVSAVSVVHGIPQPSSQLGLAQLSMMGARQIYAGIDIRITDSNRGLGSLIAT